jgi:hypothetical protein
MRYFTLLDFQHMVLAFFIGLIAVILVSVAWWKYPRPDEEEPLESLHAGSAGKSHPMPPLLIFIIAGALLWALAYVFIAGIMGGAIS